jgi:hypothetical protein
MSYPTDSACVFCKIVTGQIPCFKLPEDEHTIPSTLQPLLLPTDKYWKTSNAEYRATYRFSENMLRIKREFLAAPSEPVCQPETSRELTELLANVRRDLRSTVTFAAQP